MPSVAISSRGEARIRAGHPWVYRSDLVDVDAHGGDMVVVRAPRGHAVGLAFYSSESQIAIRMVLRGDNGTDGLAVVRARIAEAIRFRESLAIDATAYRLIHG